eukprot:2808213-Amphidinium_carterae.1
MAAPNGNLLDLSQRTQDEFADLLGVPLMQLCIGEHHRVGRAASFLLTSKMPTPMDNSHLAEFVKAPGSYMALRYHVALVLREFGAVPAAKVLVVATALTICAALGYGEASFPA